MQADDQAMRLKLQEHDLKLVQIERLMTDTITEQRDLVRELHRLTSKFDVYIERHDQVNEAAKRLWSAHEIHAKDINTLQNIVASNQPIIDGIRSLNAKLVWAILGFFMSPAVIAGLYFYSKGG